MKVYLVLYADWDGGGVEGVFSTKEKAEKYMEEYCSDNAAFFVEPWEIDGSAVYEDD